MSAELLREYLDRRGVKYVCIEHSPAYTSQEIAGLSHVSENCFAKTIIINVDGYLAMVVLPASRRLVVRDLAEMLMARHVRLATEEEFRAHFPDCEVGAMPPFGYLYDMPTYVAESLAEEHAIAFNAGSHREVIRMDFEDFSALVKPVVLDFITT